LRAILCGGQTKSTPLGATSLWIGRLSSFCRLGKAYGDLRICSFSLGLHAWHLFTYFWQAVLFIKPEMFIFCFISDESA